MTHGTLIAHTVPFEGNDISVSAEDLSNGEHEFVVKFDSMGAKVTKDDVSFCGDGSDLTGRYIKSKK